MTMSEESTAGPPPPQLSRQPGRGGNGRASALPILRVVALVIGTGMSATMAQTTCEDTVEGRICDVQQPIINGDTVPAETQRDLGLVTIGGGCSGTLINRYWVLTADHCLSANGAINGPVTSPTGVTVTAAWSPRQVVPTRFVRNWGGSGLDIGLAYLEMGDFGTSTNQLLSINEPENGNTVVKFGRGISAYANAGPPAVPAVNDGRYRSAAVTISDVGATAYTAVANASGQVADGGDSGGPDFLIAPNGIALGIVGVQSTCVASGTVPPQPLFLPSGGVNWLWVTGVPSCNSASISNDTRYDILQIVQEKPSGIDGALNELFAETEVPGDTRRPAVLTGAHYEVR